MKTISQYREEIKSLTKAAGDINAKATAENRDLLSGEVSLKNEIMDKIEELETIAANLEREERINARLDKPGLVLTKTGSREPTREDRPQDRFISLGQQMVAIMRAGVPGGSVDPRLFRAAAASGLSESVPSDGGFLVQQDFTTELLNDTIATGILAPKCRKIQISGNSNSIKINGVDETSRVSSRSGGVVAYWADEADAKTASKPKFRKIELNLKKLTGLCYATDELLDDAAALEGVIRTAFPDEFAFQIDDAIWNGTGAGTPMGILNSGALVTVAKEAGQKASTIMAENVIKMSARIFASSYQNANWFINQNTLPQLYTMSIAVGTGGQLVFVPPGGLSAAPYGMLLGRPVIPIEQAATLGTVGDIVLADLSKGYILAEKGGIRSDVSIHVRFVYDESVFRFVLRLDGQPVRASALTPYKGTSDTLSHFVALATRA
jgi:HK97 family phage major capsid protein